MAPEKDAVVGLTPEQLTKILESVGQSNATAMQKSLQRENPNPPDISPFSYPEGERAHPKAKLSRKSFFCAAQQKDDTLTPEEILAFNAITRSCTAREGRWSAVVTQNGTEHVLNVWVPCKTLDERMELPGLLAILRELKDGKAAVDPATMLQRVAELEDQVAQLKKSA